MQDSISLLYTSEHYLLIHYDHGKVSFSHVLNIHITTKEI